MEKKQFLSNFLRILVHTFYLQICHLAKKIIGLGSGIRYSGSGLNIFRIPDQRRGVKKAMESGSATQSISYS